MTTNSRNATTRKASREDPGGMRTFDNIIHDLQKLIEDPDTDSETCAQAEAMLAAVAGDATNTENVRKVAREALARSARSATRRALATRMGVAPTRATAIDLRGTSVSFPVRSATECRAAMRKAGK